MIIERGDKTIKQTRAIISQYAKFKGSLLYCTKIDVNEERLIIYKKYKDKETTIIYLNKKGIFEYDI